MLTVISVAADSFLMVYFTDMPQATLCNDR